jgi:hypothetical protein
MKTKLKLSILAIGIICLSVFSASADVESPEGPSPAFSCNPPSTNICNVVKDQNGNIISVYKGTLTMN